MWSVVAHAAPSAVVQIVTYNQNNADMFHKTALMCITSLNADLLKSLFTCTPDKKLSVTVRWIPGHLKQKEVDPSLYPDGVSSIDVEQLDGIGNSKESQKCITSFKIVGILKIAGIQQNLKH